MRKTKCSINQDERRKELLKLYKTEVLYFYKIGHQLGELCREFCMDIPTILFILRKSGIKKKTLFQIYSNQTERKESNVPIELVLKKDNFYLKKFFPDSDSLLFSSSYYWFWKTKYEKAEEKKKTCKHKIRHIRCSICNKILADATNIPLQNEVKYSKLK